MNKPHIVYVYNVWTKQKHYKCYDETTEAYGSTPEEAYKIWQQIVVMREWKSPVGIAYKLETDMKPFSLLKYVKTTYSNSSKLL